MKISITSFLIFLIQNAFGLNPQIKTKPIVILSESLQLEYGLSSGIITDGLSNCQLLFLSKPQPVNKLPRSKFNLGGFALGLFLGPIGILISYLMKGDEIEMKNLRKSALIGGVISLIIGIILAVIVISALSKGIGNFFTNIFG